MSAHRAPGRWAVTHRAGRGLVWIVTNRGEEEVEVGSLNRLQQPLHWCCGHVTVTSHSPGGPLTSQPPAWSLISPRFLCPHLPTLRTLKIKINEDDISSFEWKIAAHPHLEAVCWLSISLAASEQIAAAVPGLSCTERAQASILSGMMTFETTETLNMDILVVM